MTADTWEASLERLVAVPSVLAEPAMKRSDAVWFTGCTDEVWDSLVAAGFPEYDSGTGPAYDPDDVFNLALHAGTRQSAAERALTSALRFLTEPPESWERSRSWDLQAQASCAEGVPGPWTFWPPESPPEAFPGMGSYRVETTGYHRTVASPVARDLARELFEADLHYVRRKDHDPPATVIARGVVDCFSGSRVLADRLRAAGFEAVERTGWLLGPLTSTHCWVEFLDSDGEWKCLDLAFHALARTLFGLDSPLLGSKPDRFAATRCPWGEPLLRHSCPAGNDTLAVSSGLSP